MKGSEFANLKQGQLVRLRHTGVGAQDPRNGDEFIIGRIATDERYRNPNDRFYRSRGTTITVDGTTFNGATAADDGDARLVLMVKVLYARDARAADGSWPWRHYQPQAHNRLVMLIARDVIGVWDDQIEAAELTERQERFDARSAASEVARARQARQHAEREADFDLIRGAAQAAGVRAPYQGDVLGGRPVFTVTDVVRMLHVVWEQAQVGTGKPNPYSIDAGDYR